jgi:competence ComEA-like helix-hairpin-helix protein
LFTDYVFTAMAKKVYPYFYFLPSERRAINVLLLLIGAVWLAPLLLRYWRPVRQADFSALEEHLRFWRPAETDAAAERPAEAAGELFYFDPNTASVETLIRLGVPSRVAHTLQRYRERGGRFRQAEDLAKIYTMPEEVFERLRPYVRIGNAEPLAGQSPGVKGRNLFAFDPNTASREDLLRLGLSPHLVERLLRYREKGGTFRQRSDFRKLYGLSEADYQRLEPYIAIAQPETLAVQPVAYNYSESPAVFSRRVPTFIDVNAADAEAWTRLPGIGTARAKSIIQYRERLGGFLSVEQVGETFGLPDSVFQTIRRWLRVETPLYRKISLNTADIKELAAHPYISYQQARLIVAYREQHGPYKSPEDLRNIAAFTDLGWLEKVIPYLEAL